MPISNLICDLVSELERRWRYVRMHVSNSLFEIDPSMWHLIDDLKQEDFIALHMFTCPVDIEISLNREYVRNMLIMSQNWPEIIASSWNFIRNSSQHCRYGQLLFSEQDDSPPKQHLFSSNSSMTGTFPNCCLL